MNFNYEIIVYDRICFTNCRYSQISIDYADFVWFILAEEDKTSPTSLEFWFKILDQDGDGIISMFDLDEFYFQGRVCL